MGKYLIIMTIAAVIAGIGFAENVDPYDDESQYAYGENSGWLNFEPATGDGAQVTETALTGFVWAQNIGWISLSCENTSSCGTVNYGLTNDGSGNLAGYAWSENVGWISFSCHNTSSCGTVSYGVTIDDRGSFAGWAWGENIGWLNFNSAQLFDRGVRACKVTFDDLANFAADWLTSNPTSPADLISPTGVNGTDYAAFASRWHDYCPDGWELK